MKLALRVAVSVAVLALLASLLPWARCARRWAACPAASGWPCWVPTWPATP
jgi:hypothetical protein